LDDSDGRVFRADELMNPFALRPGIDRMQRKQQFIGQRKSFDLQVASAVYRDSMTVFTEKAYCEVEGNVLSRALLVLVVTKQYVQAFPTMQPKV